MTGKLINLWHVYKREVNDVATYMHVWAKYTLHPSRLKVFPYRPYLPKLCMCAHDAELCTELYQSSCIPRHFIIIFCFLCFVFSWGIATSLTTGSRSVAARKIHCVSTAGNLLFSFLFKHNLIDSTYFFMHTFDFPKYCPPSFHFGSSVLLHNWFKVFYERI